MPFQKGNKLGAKGRPTARHEERHQMVLLAVFDEQAERAATLAMVRQAKKGNVAAFKELMDRKYGKVSENVDHGGTVVIQIREERPKGKLLDADFG